MQSLWGGGTQFTLQQSDSVYRSKIEKKNDKIYHFKKGQMAKLENSLKIQNLAL